MMTTDYPVLKHHAVPWPERKTEIWSWKATPSLILHEAQVKDAHVVYLLAGPYAHERPTRDWWLAPAHDGWHISNYTSDPPQARYTRDGYRVDVHTTAPWFGHETDRHRVYLAWQLLSRLAHGMFDPHASLMGTPARTGLDLLQRSLPERGEYPVAPDDVRQIMHANAPQGRIEFIPTQARTAPLAWVDARWQYAACVSNMPCGEMRHEKTHSYIEHIPAFYFARWRAPSDWRYPFGLLPEPTGLQDGQRFRYPHDDRWHCGWVTGAEFELARDSGWDVRVSERISFDMTQPDPLKNWASKLRRMRTYTSDELVAGAVRHLLIDPIGAFNRVARRELHITPRADAASIPADAYGEVVLGDTIEWFRDAPLSKDLLPFVHPEISWTVWGRSRARLHRNAMRYLDTTPGGEIEAFRSDAFVVTQAPNWLDDGKIGTFRVKRLMGAGPVPQSEDEYRALLHEEDEDNG